jgi:hypothetical protein
MVRREVQGPRAKVQSYEGLRLRVPVYCLPSTVYQRF